MANTRIHGVHIDTEYLISLVKPKRPLWDCAHTDYRNRDKRTECWTQVANAIFQNFSQLPSNEQKDILYRVFQRWRNVRDAYIRERSQNEREARCGTFGRRRRTYLYSKHLEFLRNTSVRFKHHLRKPEERIIPKREINVDSDNDQQQQSQTELDDKMDMFTNHVLNGSNDDMQEHLQYMCTPSLSQPDNTNSMEDDNPPSQINMQIPDPPPLNYTGSSTAALKIATVCPSSNGIEQELLKLIRVQREEAEDEDKAFFASLLPTIRQFNNDDKLLLRSQILQLIISIKQSKSDSSEND